MEFNRGGVGCHQVVRHIYPLYPRPKGYPCFVAPLYPLMIHKQNREQQATTKDRTTHNQPANQTTPNKATKKYLAGVNID